MNDPTANSVVELDGSELSDEISRSMGSVWARHTGERPTSISTEVGTDRVRCVITGELAPAADEADEPDAQPAVLLTVSAQRSEAIESVRRATHRRVVGFISRRDDDAGTSTQTFVLDGRRAKN